MQVMTKEQEEAFRKQGSTENKSEAETMVIAHYFSSSWDWWATEYDPETKTFFGLVKGFEIELGYFSLAELEEFSREKYPLAGIERDLHWTPKSLAEVRREAARR